MMKQQVSVKGFTLIELIVVVAIIAILSAVIVPIYLNLDERAKQGVAIGYATNLAGAINQHNSDPVNTKIASASNWSTQTDVNNFLGNLSVQFSNPEYINDAAGRINIDPNSYIATVNTTIS